jgi:hypothetical protein
MATAASTFEPVMTAPLLIALVTLKGYEESAKGNHLYIKDLANYLVDLQRAGVDIRRIALSGLPGNYWSDDIARFVGEGIVVGDIKHKSPLDITKDCVQVCLNAINDRVKKNQALKAEINKARAILNLETFQPL